MFTRTGRTVEPTTEADAMCFLSKMDNIFLTKVLQ